MLDWLESPQLRQLCQAGLNKSEQRHALAQVICTFKQGRIADRGQDTQQFRASGLNLVIAAIVYWNSTYRKRGSEALGRSVGVGWRPVPGHELIDAVLRPTVHQPGEQVGDIGERIDAVQFARLDQ